MLLFFLLSYLPLFAVSLVSILIIEKSILRRFPPVAHWLGLST